jgi:pimeloyl-ACP methyl ester carboxylesterase
LLEKS